MLKLTEPERTPGKTVRVEVYAFTTVTRGLDLPHDAVPLGELTISRGDPYVGWIARALAKPGVRRVWVTSASRMYQLKEGQCSTRD